MTVIAVRNVGLAFTEVLHSCGALMRWELYIQAAYKMIVIVTNPNHAACR